MSIFLTKPAKLGPVWESQALPVTSQDKVVSDTGVTPLKKRTLVQLARLVEPCKSPLPGYREVLKGSVGGGGDFRYCEAGGRGNPSSWG